MDIAEHDNARTALAASEVASSSALTPIVDVDGLEVILGRPAIPAIKPCGETARFADAEIEMRIRLEERDRIARELHDSTSQLLVTLDLQLIRLKQMPRARNKDDFVDVVSELGTIVAELHDSVRALAAPELFDPKCLARDLAAMAAEFALQTHVEVSTGFGELPAAVTPAMAGALYRVSQEALANACRHGRAKQVWLSLAADPQSITLRVIDDGIGFAAPALGPYSGHGIANMKARMNELGGTLSIRNLDAGAMVEARISLAPESGFLLPIEPAAV
jgi:signal transduction histidine kinase